MARCYVNLIQFGRKNYSDVPSYMKEQVKAEMERRVRDGEMSQELYDELIVK